MGGCCSSTANHTHSVTNTERSKLSHADSDSDSELGETVTEVVSEPKSDTEGYPNTSSNDDTAQPKAVEKMISPGLAGLASLAEDLGNDEENADDDQKDGAEITIDEAFNKATHPTSPSGSELKAVADLELDDSSPMPASMPPVHSADVEVMVITLDLDWQEKDGHRKESSSRRRRSTLKSSTTTRSNVYVNGLYFSEYEDGPSLIHPKVGTAKYNSRSFNANLIDIRETLTFEVVAEGLVREENSQKEDAFYMNDFMHFAIKQTAGALRKPKVLGYFDLKLNQLDRNGEWQEWEAEILESESSDHRSEGVRCGTAKIKGRFLWSADMIREYRSKVLSDEKKKRNSGKHEAFKRKMSVKDRVISLDVFSDTTTSLSSIHGFIMTETAAMKIRVMGVLFGKETAEEWTIYQTAEELKKEMEHQGSAVMSPDSPTIMRLSNISISGDYRCGLEIINRQETGIHSSKACEVLFIGEDMRFTVLPFEDDGEYSEAQKTKHAHPQYVFGDRQSGKAPGTILLRAIQNASSDKTERLKCVGVSVLNVLDVVSEVRRKDDEDEPVLLRLKMFEWLSESELKMAIDGGSQAMRRFENGSMIIQVNCEFT